ncbi:MAG: hypothetical protein ACE5K4_01415 [Candidatus Hydrothermarchaeota archaeon]
MNKEAYKVSEYKIMFAVLEILELEGEKYGFELVSKIVEIFNVSRYFAHKIIEKMLSEKLISRRMEKRFPYRRIFYLTEDGRKILKDDPWKILK